MKRSVRLLIVCSLASVAVVLGTFQSAAQADVATPTAIEHVTIVTEPGSVIESGTILIEQGRITDAGTDVDVPAHALIVDGTGLIAYPGFIDSHTHMGIPATARAPEERKRMEDVNPDPAEGPLAATRFANRRGIRPHDRAFELYSPKKEQVEGHRAVGFTAALVAPRDGILGGTSALLNLSDRPLRRSILLQDVGMHGSFNAGEDGDYPESLLGVFAQFRQVMLDAGWYVRTRKYSERHPTTATRAPIDPALEALQPLRARQQRLVFEANSENEIRRALNLAGEFQLDVAISGAKEAWKVIDRIKAEHVPLIISLEFDPEPEYGKVTSNRNEEAGAKGEGKRETTPMTIYEPLRLRKERRRLWEEQVENVIRLHESGVSFALRTGDFEKPTEFWKNLQLVIRRGLPEEAAVAALTTNAADILGMQDQLGAIRRGRLANLTLMTGPIADEKSRVRFVLIDGEKFEIEAGKDADGAKDSSDSHADSDTIESFVSQETDTASASGTTESVKTESTPSSTEDKGPIWATEVEADRFPKTRTGGDVVIRNTTILPVTSPRIENASIMIRNGKIEGLGAVTRVPDGVIVIDGTGLFVMPGIIDCHSHLGLDQINESSLAITAEVRVADVVNPQSVGIYRALAGGVTAHHALHGSTNPIGGQNVIAKLKFDRPVSEMLMADAPPTIKFALGENVTHANWHESQGKRFPNSRMGVEALMREAFEASRTYRRTWDEYDRQTKTGEDVPPPRRDLRLEALSDTISGRLTVHPHCYRSDEILRLLAVAEDYGFRIGTLQHALEGYRIAPEIARHGCGASVFANLWAYKVEAYGAIPHNAALMTQHAIAVSVNSDSPDRIRYLNQEAAKCIKWGGLDETEALELITLNPARQMRIDHRVGSLEVGKDGDLAIFNGHPLNTFSKCVMTLIDGEVFFEDPRPAPTEPCTTLKLPAHVDSTIPQTLHRAYAIAGATVHPMSGPIMRDSNIVIMEDKIHDIGPDAVVPPGVGVIDGSGLHVYPGLIDAGSVLGLLEIWQVRATSDTADTATFAPQLRAASAINPHSEHIRVARTTGITTTLTTPSGGTISGQSAVIHLDGWTMPEMLVADDYALHMTVPSLPVHLPEDKKERERLTKEHKEATRKLDAFMEQAKRYAKLKGVADMDSEVEFEVDLTLETMVPYLGGAKPVVFRARTYKQILDTIAFAEKYGLRCVLSGAQEAWKLAQVLAEKDIPVILGSPLDYPSDEHEPWDSVYRCAGELDRAGVRFCFASNDAAGTFNLPIEVGMAVAHGLPRERAEYALTLGAAEILGIADRVGSIEVGKQADLIVSTDTPLQAASQVRHMFIAGRPVELASIHTETYEKFKRRPKPKLSPAPTLVGPPSLTR